MAQRIIMTAITVLFCASVYATTDYTIGFAVDASTNSINSNGFTFTPSIQGNGSGTFEISEKVQINYIEVLFYGGSGVKDAVTSVNRSLALFTSISTVAPENVVSQAVGNIVLPWSNATAMGSSGTNTWIRYNFSGTGLVLDQDTKYVVAFIGSNGYALGSGANFQATGVRVTTNTYPGGALLNSTPAEYTYYDTTFRANFTPVPEPATVSLLVLGTLTLLGRRNRK